MEKIPTIYLDEFFKQQADLITSRAKLAAWLFVITFFVGSTVTIGALNEELGQQLVLTWTYSAVVLVITYLIFYKRGPLF